MARSFVRLLSLVGACASVLLLTGCGEEKPVSSATSQFKPADASDATAAEAPGSETGGRSVAKKSSPAQPKAITVDELDADSLPEGPPEAILAFMRQMDGYKPRGVTRDAQRSDLIRVLRLMMEAGDRALAHEEATPEQRREAAQQKLSAVMNLARLGEPKADEELTAYCLRLKKDEDPAVSQIGRSILFSIEVAKLQDGTKDPAPVLAQLKELLEGDDPEHVIFVLGTQAAHAFNQRGFAKEAAEALTLLGNKYKDDADEQIAAQAKILLKQVRLVELDLRGKLEALFADKPDEKAPGEVVETVKTMLAATEVEAMELGFAGQASDILERTDNYDAAREVLDLIATRFATVKDEALADEARQTLESANKRLALLGQPLEITGKTLDGQPFDSASLQGKVVLVDFWATWCEPCLAEIPNIQKYYDQYKDQGFEVIGYNLDKNPMDVEQFFAVQKLPWQTVLSADETKVGFDSPLAQQCGVQSIPFLVLIDAEGKVVALHTRGEKLGQKLAELLGPVK